MKSHVRENILKNFFASQMHMKTTDNGYKEVTFDEFARGLIEKQLLESSVKLSDWRIYDDGTWSATVSGTDRIIRGRDISNVISIAISEEGGVNDL